MWTPVSDDQIQFRYFCKKKSQDFQAPVKACSPSERTSSTSKHDPRTHSNPDPLWQCSGSVTFWYGFGSADPYHLFTNPGLDPDPDPALYFSDFQDVNKKNKFVSPFLLITVLLTVGAHTSVLKRTSHKT
jgi:hypothetical protein